MVYRYNISTKKERLTLGFLSDNAGYESENEILLGATEAAKKYDVNLIYISHLEDSNLESFMHFTDLNQKITKQIRSKYDKLEKVLKQLDIDGLMFIGWSKDFDEGKIQYLQDTVNTIPLLSLGKDFPHIPSVYMHGGKYIKKIYSHLFVDHNCKNIAFFSPWNYDSRIDNFREIMKDYMNYNEDLIITQDDLSGILDGHTRVRRALSIILDDRKQPVDAIMVMTAIEGKYTLELLQERGFQVPEDIKLICYEEDPLIAYSNPPLTTIDYPNESIGYKGCEQLIKLLISGEIPLITEVPTEILYRDSCGCRFNYVKKYDAAAIETYQNSLSDFNDTFICEIDSLLSKRHPKIPIPYDKLSRLFLADIQEDDSEFFILEFKRYLIGHASDMTELQILGLIEDFRDQLLPLYKGNRILFVRGERIWFFARYIARDIANFSVINGYIEDNLINRKLSVVNQSLLSANSIEKIRAVLNNSLKELRIPSCYLLLSDGNLDDQRVKFSYFAYRQNEMRDSNLLYVYNQFKAMKKERFSIVFMLHHLDNDQTAILLIEPSLNHNHLIIQLGVHISTVLKGALLVEKSQALINKLAYLADTDTLTDLYNRRYFYDSLEYISKCDSPYSIFYLDIDGFKNVNDTYGHDVGDQLLQEIAKRLTAVLGEVSYPLNNERLYGKVKTNAIYRLGGDEFTALIEGNDIEKLSLYAAKLTDKIGAPYNLSGNPINVSCSIGISRFPYDSVKPEQLLKRADMALYFAKTRKNTFVFYDK